MINSRCLKNSLILTKLVSKRNMNFKYTKTLQGQDVSNRGLDPVRLCLTYFWTDMAWFTLFTITFGRKHATFLCPGSMHKLSPFCSWAHNYKYEDRPHQTQYNDISFNHYMSELLGEHVNFGFCYKHKLGFGICFTTL